MHFCEGREKNVGEAHHGGAPLWHPVRRKSLRRGLQEAQGTVHEGAAFDRICLREAGLDRPEKRRRQIVPTGAQTSQFHPNASLPVLVRTTLDRNHTWQRSRPIPRWFLRAADQRVSQRICAFAAMISPLPRDWAR